MATVTAAERDLRAAESNARGAVCVDGAGLFPQGIKTVHRGRRRLVSPAARSGDALGRVLGERGRRVCRHRGADAEQHGPGGEDDEVGGGDSHGTSNHCSRSAISRRLPKPRSNRGAPAGRSFGSVKD